jgi:hypothetical protein
MVVSNKTAPSAGVGRMHATWKESAGAIGSAMTPRLQGDVEFCTDA